jgi:integrase/recombinase XerD
MKISGFGQAAPLTKEQFAILLLSFSNTKHRLIAALCWYSLERPITVLRLKTEQLYAGDGKPLDRLLLPAPQRKDRKTRELPICPALRFELSLYSAPGHGYLFPSPRDDSAHLSWSAWEKALTRQYQKLGYRGYSTYSFRRGGITALARAGLSAPAIQAVTGHSSLASLQRYIEIDQTEIRSALSLL